MFTYQEDGARDGKGLFKEVGSAVESDHVPHVINTVVFEERG